MAGELIIVSLDGKSRRIPLEQDLITIGRSPMCDLAFPENSSLSRQHAAIRRDGETWLIIDLGSKNGTFRNGESLAEPTPLCDGDRIQVGNLALIYAGAAGAGEASRAAIARRDLDAGEPEPAPATGPAVLTFPGRKLRVTVTDAAPFAFGRSSTLFRAAAENVGVVCVKLFPQVKGAGWESAAAFEREVLAQTTLRHPNILPVLDYGLQSLPHGSPFLVLPYCDGGSLRNLVRERSFYPLSAVRDLLQQAAAGLDAAHGAGFVHGDIKPENILLSGDRSHAYLSDFGVSNVFPILERFTTAVPGAPGGTTVYLSPEQISQGQQTALSDIYSFAMLAYELLTGRLPFDQDLPVFRQMMAKVTGEIQDPRRFSPLVTEPMKAALLAGLNRDPLQRPRSATLFCKLLMSAQEELPAPAATTRGSRVFISYSHHDSQWLERVRVHLRPIERQQQIEFWDDTRIRPGSDWRQEIERALGSAACAILLVSPNFLASDFCTVEEVPRLLCAAQDRGVSILPVIVSPCRFEQTPEIAKFQTINPPSRTLAEMPSPECDRALVRLAEVVQQCLKGR